MHYHKYADDTQLYTSLTVPAGSSLDRLARCTSELQHWYWANGLLLNPTKSEVAFFRTKQRLQWVTLPANVTVAGSSVTVKGVLKILGVTLDSTLTFDNHANNVVRSYVSTTTSELCDIFVFVCPLMLPKLWQPA